MFVPEESCRVRIFPADVPVQGGGSASAVPVLADHHTNDSASAVPLFGGHHRLDSLVVPVLDPEEPCHVRVFPADVHVQGGGSASGGPVLEDHHRLDQLEVFLFPVFRSDDRVHLFRLVHRKLVRVKVFLFPVLRSDDRVHLFQWVHRKLVRVIVPVFPQEGLFPRIYRLAAPASGLPDVHPEGDDPTYLRDQASGRRIVPQHFKECIN